jgi:hypothetical protein
MALRAAQCGRCYPVTAPRLPAARGRRVRQKRARNTHGKAIDACSPGFFLATDVFLPVALLTPAFGDLVAAIVAKERGRAFTDVSLALCCLSLVSSFLLCALHPNPLRMAKTQSRRAAVWASDGNGPGFSDTASGGARRARLDRRKGRSWNRRCSVPGNNRVCWFDGDEDPEKTHEDG